MSGLKLGDLILDARRVAYVASLRALVCSDLHEALNVRISQGLRGVVERIDALFKEYRPEHLIVFGAFSEESPLAGIARRWGKKAKVHFVTSKPDQDAVAIAEGLGCEVHHQLIWGRYCFVDDASDEPSEIQLMTITGKPRYAIRVGRTFGGMKLMVFLKGQGRLIVPSLNSDGGVHSVFTSRLERYDIFAVGYQLVLPMGKVADLKPFKGIGGSLSVTKATLGSHLKGPLVSDHR